MYPVTEAYKAESLKNDRQTRITGTITLTNGAVIPLTNDDFDKAPSWSNQCVNSDELSLGSTYQGQLTFTFFSNLDRYTIYDANVFLSQGLWIPSRNEWEDVPIGEFYVSECTLQGLNKLKVTCLDHMDDLDVDYDGATVSGTPADIMNYVATKTGITLGQTAAEIVLLPNGNVVFGLPAESSVKTYRDMVHDLAACLACYATMGRDGKLYLKKFLTTPVATISANHRGNDSISDYKVSYTAVGCTKNGTYIEVGDSDGKCLDLGSNEFLQLGLDEVTESVLENILDNISGLEYVPASLTLIKSDPSYDLGDVIEATGYTAGTSIMVPVHKFKWTWRGSQKIEAVGKDPRIGDTKSREQKRMESQMAKLKTLENDVLPLQNVTAVNIGSSWSQVVRGKVALSENKKLLFHAAVRLLMNAAGAVKFKYSLNGVEEDFIHECQVPAGIHTVTLFMYISGVSTQVNDFRVYVSSDDATGTVPQLGLKGAITGPGMISPGWGGTLEIEEEFTAFVGGQDIVGISENITIDRQAPTKITASDTFTPFVGGLEIVGLSDNMALTREKEQYYLVTENGDNLATEDGDIFIT